MHKFDLVNRNGAPLCDHYGCRRHKDLIYVFRGRFCRKHAAKLAEIRDKVQNAKTTGDLVAEREAREEEMLARKTMEGGHMYRLLKVERIVGSQPQT